MNRPARSAAILALCLLSLGTSQAAPPAVSVTGQTAGSTPFLAQVLLSTSSPGTLKSVAFEITPKLGSLTRPVSAVYLADYLEARGYFNPNIAQVTVPIFGLYSHYPNTVTLTTRFTDGTALTSTVTITTPGFVDAYGYNAPEQVLPRTNSTALSYDYILFKAQFGRQNPVILDTDGELRWVGTNNDQHFSVIFYDNSLFVAATPPGVVPSYPPAPTTHTGLTRMELDGNYQFIEDYRAEGVTSTDHHNYDPGKLGFLMCVDTSVDQESVVFEVNTAGTILNRWNLGDIITATMMAGGDDPTTFVKRQSADWFHNNSNVYRASDDTVIVSSRENFLIALDYQTGVIKWILGDPTKAWYQYPSLRQYALTLANGSLPPIGQHAVSITHDDDVMVFDNGMNSDLQVPAGASRSYSAPRKYHLDLTARIATEVWNYEANESRYSPIVSSVYEDDPSNYLIDYADEYIGGVQAFVELLGLDPTGAQVFDYRYPATTAGYAWNAIPIHIENLVFTGPSTALAAGHPKFFTGEEALANGVYYLEFPGNGNVFGYYSYLSDPGFIYHFDLGYEYIFNVTDSRNSVYLYDFASKHVFYTSPEYPFPYLYDFNLNAVLYYDFDPAKPGTSSPRTFYNFGTGNFIRM